MTGRTGFTLVEVMIVLAIVILLAALAWPSYAAYVVRSKRVEAVSALMETMQQQERLYSRRNRYLAFSRDDNPERLRWHSAADPRRSSHEISARPCGEQSLAACVELVAVPGSAAVDSAFRDPVCGTLTLNSQGVRSPEHAACWQ
ncbi:type IV pilin protein [Noviherbaspirillum aridicola]|uniref:Type IV pilus assembly protein PilE n=1 Tax=Noviherbaspirillum aridicola TaxID=2849687 RepID=A0ABQ4Q9D5_9BURK|nr:type IV pilin protein [Noviherbaspirillum aridicola]GIZ53834.1 hypothetical protein NCCP691_38480 [Noviherbaspirillum aridicola]